MNKCIIKGVNVFTNEEKEYSVPYEKTDDKYSLLSKLTEDEIFGFCFKEFIIQQVTDE